MVRVPIGEARGERLFVTSHAATRWAARVRGDDGLPAASAEQDLRRCAQVAEFATDAPPWLLVDDFPFTDTRYLMLGDDIAIIVVPDHRGVEWTATTVVTRADRGSVHVARRRTARHERLVNARLSSPRRMRSDYRHSKTHPYDDYDD